MSDLFAERKRWNLLDKMNKRIFETFEVEKGQLRILIDFFCYDVISNELMNNIEYYSDDVNGSGIKEILENQITNYRVMLEEMSINIQNKFDRLYWDCLGFGYDIKELQAEIYHIRKCLIEEMTANNFYMDPEVIYGTLYEILSSLEKIERNVEDCEMND